MNYIYKAYVPHGITFINILGTSKNTWKDWKIVPTSRPVFRPPAVKTVKVDIPGADGILDMTESLTGEVHYNNRTGSIEFQVENKNNWYDVYSEIMDYLHGQQMRAILDDDFAYYYNGRFSVNEWRSEQYRSKIVIDYDVEPYKYEIFSSLEDWEWDSFNFETGIIREYKELIVDEMLVFDIEGSRRPVLPKIIITSDDGTGMRLSVYRFSTNTWQRWSLTDGTNIIPDFIIRNEKYRLRFQGYGTVSIDYRGGRL